MSYLLDTNAFVDHIRYGPKSKVTSKLLMTPPRSVYLCTVVLAELIYGAVRSGPEREASNRAKIEALRLSFPNISFDGPAAEEYGKLRARLADQGQPIGPNDMLIAAIALAHGMTMVTNNTAEFRRIPGLDLEDWQ